MADVYRDYIPEGEDTGALGSGFKDYLPPATPQPQPVEEVKEEKPAKK